MDEPYEPQDPRTQVYLRIKWFQEWSPVITVIVSALALIVIGVQVVVYIQQRNIMSKTVAQYGETRELENRAWVGVKPPEYRYIKALNDVTIVTIYINTGHVPATGTLIVNGKCLTEAPPDDAPYENPITRPSKLVFMPGVDMPDGTAKLKGFPFCG